MLKVLHENDNVLITSRGGPFHTECLLSVRKAPDADQTDKLGLESMPHCGGALLKGRTKRHSRNLDPNKLYETDCILVAPK